MNTWVEAPPRRTGSGCFARGCLIVLVFAIVLAIACFAGVYWGLQRHSAIAHGIYWLAKTHSIGDAPAPIPESDVSEEQIRTIRERWQDFEQKTRAGQAAEIELTADDINALIASNRHARGKAFVSIDGNQLRLQMSAPLGEILGRPGYYINGDITIELRGAESLDNPQLSRIVVNGAQIPGDVLNWKYRSRRLKEYLGDYRDSYNLGTIDIRDGKVILRSRTE